MIAIEYFEIVIWYVHVRVHGVQLNVSMINSKVKIAQHEFIGIKCPGILGSSSEKVHFGGDSGWIPTTKLNLGRVSLSWLHIERDNQVVYHAMLSKLIEEVSTLSLFVVRVWSDSNVTIVYTLE